jgi:Zn-dependent M28 family amino/carboxypeptidase
MWDEEEVGKIGSSFYAAQADSNDMEIKGVLNFEMSGWDSNDDGLMDIHTRPISNSVLLSNFMFAIDSIYNLPLQPVIYNPGTTASDHSSFWQQNYSAICFSEAYYGGDFNPYYHSAQDRIDKFNLAYFHNVAKLGIASTATLAMENLIVSVHENENLPYSISINNFPNPFNNSTVIQYIIPEEGNISLDLYNTIGEKIENLSDGYKKPGTYEFYFDGSAITSSVYFIILKTSNHIYSHKILLLK